MSKKVYTSNGYSTVNVSNTCEQRYQTCQNQLNSQVAELRMQYGIANNMNTQCQADLKSEQTISSMFASDKNKCTSDLSNMTTLHTNVLSENTNLKSQLNEYNIKITDDATCGVNNKICPTGQFCSIYGWCGVADIYKEPTIATQYKQCNNNETPETAPCLIPGTQMQHVVKLTSDSRCGINGRICNKNTFCSSSGWCGVTDEHKKNSDYSQFRECNANESSLNDNCMKLSAQYEPPQITTNSRCGFNNKMCDKGNYCSPSGWCGNTDEHKKINLMSKYRKCNDGENPHLNYCLI